MKHKFSSVFFTVMCLLMVVYGGLAQELNLTDAQGLKQGKWKKLYENGKTRYEGQFKDDQPIGLFQYFYENGELQATNNHIGNGEVANHAYHKNGKIKAKGMYQQTKKDSLWQYFNEHEQLVLEERYINDTLHGPQRTYYENKQLGEETNFVKGVKHGPWLKFFDNGKPWVEASYEKGNLHGAFKMYRDAGKPKVQGKYHLGIRTGAWLKFNDNGSVHVQELYANGVLKSTKFENGEFTDYYEDEIPKSVYNYKKGMKEGEFKEFYDVGEWIRTESPGKMDGPTEVTEQLVGTKVKMSGWYHDDKLNGKVTYFKEDGSTERVEVWEEGVLISTINWEGKPNE